MTRSTRNGLQFCLPYLALGTGFGVMKDIWLATLLYHAVVVGWLVLGRQGAPLRVWKGWRWGPGVGMCLACALVSPVILVLWPVIARPGIELEAELAEYGVRNWWLFVGYISTVHPVLEEVYWRGMGPKTVGCDAAFAGFHVILVIPFIAWGWTLGVVVVLFAAARIWRGLVARTGGLLIPILSHAIADLAIMLAVHGLS